MLLLNPCIISSSIYSKNKFSTIGDKMNIFFPAGGRRVELINLFKKELKAFYGRAVVGDIVNTAPALYFADRAYLLPEFNSEKCYTVFKNIYEYEGIDLVIPLLDYEIDYYSDNYTRIKSDGINVMISDSENIKVFRNKKKTHEAFRSLDIPTPAQYNWDSVEEKFPVIIKPVKGSAAMKVNVVSDQNELDMIVNRTGKEEFEKQFVIEELVKGEEVTSDVLIDLEGRVLAISQRQRIKVRAGEVECAKTVNHRDIREYIELYFSSFKARGVLNVQCMYGKDGPRFTEINARFGGGYPLSHHAGCNFPRGVINMYKNNPVKSMSSQLGCYMCRFDNAVYLEEKELIND